MQPSEHVAAPDLFAALAAGDLDSIRRLVSDKPERVTRRNDAGLSAVMLARYQFRLEALELLLSVHPPLDAFEAAAVGDTERLAALLDADAAIVAAFSADGFPALGLAAFFGNSGCVRLLLEHGADPNLAAGNAMAVQPLHAAAAGPHVEICALLLERGAAVNARQQGGWTPLHAAAQHGDGRLVEHFLRHGADPRLRNDDGLDAAAVAVQNGHVEIAASLRAATGPAIG